MAAEWDERINSFYVQNNYATKRRYAVQDAAFSNPDAYIGIYQTLSA